MRLLFVQYSIVTPRMCSIFLNRNAKLAFLFVWVPRSRGPVQNLRSRRPAFLKCQERGNVGARERESRNARPSLPATRLNTIHPPGPLHIIIPPWYQHHLLPSSHHLQGVLKTTLYGAFWGVQPSKLALKKTFQL